VPTAAVVVEDPSDLPDDQRLYRPLATVCHTMSLSADRTLPIVRSQLMQA